MPREYVLTKYVLTYILHASQSCLQAQVWNEVPEGRWGKSEDQFPPFRTECCFDTSLGSSTQRKVLLLTLNTFSVQTSNFQQEGYRSQEVYGPLLESLKKVAVKISYY